MEFSEAIIKTFTKEPHPLVWQPRLEEWYHANARNGTLPPKYKDVPLLAIYDEFHASVRGYNICFKISYDEEINISVEHKEDRTITTWRTPSGTLQQIELRGAQSSQTVEFPIKTIDDIPALKCLLEHRNIVLDPDAYNSNIHKWNDGKRAVPTTFLPRIPILQLILEYMGFESTIYALYENPAEIEGLMEFIEEADNAIYEVTKKSSLKLANFGDNLHSDLISPPLFKKYALPHYQRRSAELHSAGIYCYPHWDGNVKPILHFSTQCGFDGVEAITPKPQGDVDIDDIAQNIGDLILLDGIPAVSFLPWEKEKDLIKIVEKLLSTFAPNLILGISDELPPDGNIEQVRLVSEIVEDWNSKNNI